MVLIVLYLLKAVSSRRPESVSQAPEFWGPALGAGYGGQMQALNPAEQSAAQFKGAIEQLQKRLREMETAMDKPSAAGESGSAEALPVGEIELRLPEAKSRGARVALLLGKGQALLSLQQPENAIVCFDEVIAVDPTIADAFVRKGTALERLGRLDEAIENYDRAIALDHSLTMAYLCKGGVFNRLERYSEALQCYEQALRTKQEVAASQAT
jgi:tetratricopeptide (TPR) repeat protein